MDNQIIDIPRARGNWQVPVSVLESSRSEMTIHFACGLCLEPNMYEDYLTQLYEGLDKKASIFASSISGGKIKSDADARSTFQTNTRTSIVDLFHEVIKEIGKGNDVNIAHSSGPRTTPNDLVEMPQKYVLINPIVPVDYGTLGFLRRCASLYASLWGSTREKNDMDNMLASEHKAASNFLRNLRNNIAFTNEFKRLTMEQLYPRTDADALLLFAYGPNISDGLFQYQGSTVHNMEKQYRSLRFKKMEGEAHDEIIGSPAQFADKTLEFLM